MIKQDKLEKAKTMLSGGNASLWCGFCNKKHTTKDMCARFKDMIAKLVEREGG